MQLVELYSVLELILSHFTMFQKQVPKKINSLNSAKFRVTNELFLVILQSLLTVMSFSS